MTPFSTSVSDLFKTVALLDADTGLMSEQELQTLPNIGPAVAAMLVRLGVEQPADLRGQTADALYERLCQVDGRRHDPCLLDTLVAAVDYVHGAPARPWWYYSRIRKTQG